MTTDPFMDPAKVSARPTVASFRGRLIMVKPLKQETVPNRLGQPGATQERVTADVTVVDGAGPVPLMEGNPPRPTGATLEGPEFPRLWLQNEYIVAQLSEALRAGGVVLGRVDLPIPDKAPGKGNAWGIVKATDADKQMARDFLAGRLVSGAQAPAQVVSQAPAPPQTTAPVSHGNPFA